MAYTKAHLDAIDDARRQRRLDVTWPDGRRSRYTSPQTLLQVRNDIELAIARADLQAVKAALDHGVLEVELAAGRKTLAARADLEQLRTYIAGRVVAFSQRKPVPERRVIPSPFLH